MKCIHPIAMSISTSFAFAFSTAAYGQGGPGALPWKQTNLVRLHAEVAAARAVGVFAACSDKIAAEECAFTVEGVRYTPAGATAASTRFDAICIDIGFPDGAGADAWNCSPVTFDGLAIAVDAGAGGAVVANGGVNTGSTSGVGTNGQIHLGLGMALPVSARLRVPMARRTLGQGKSVGLGGNILMESRIGPVSAGQTVVFGHTPFDGAVTFMVTRPSAMSLTIGRVNAAGETTCTRSGGAALDCPAELARALRSACELSTGGPCADEANDATAPTTAFGPDFDTAELRALLDKHQETMATVSDNLEDKLPDRLTEVFEMLEADEDEEEDGVAGRRRLGVFNKVKTHLREKVLPRLQEIKDTVQEQVACPS